MTFEQARKTLEALLQEERKRTRSAVLSEKHFVRSEIRDGRIPPNVMPDYETLLCVSRESDTFIAHGTHQMVLRINENFVAKAPYMTLLNKDILVFGARDIPFMKHTVDMLNEVGLNVPERQWYRAELLGGLLSVSADIEHTPYSLRFSETAKIWPNMQITENLHKDGYDLIELAHMPDTLDNAREIRDEFNHWKNKLLFNYNNGELHMDPHGYNHKPHKGIMHIFGLRVKDNKGELLVKDVDHVYAVPQEAYVTREEVI